MVRLVVVMHARFPLSLRNVEDLLFCQEAVRMWWDAFGQMFAGSE